MIEQQLPVINFTPFPTLETNRFVLRRVTTSDVNEVFALRSDPEIMRYIARPLAKTTQDTLDFLAMLDKGLEDNDFINWAICFKEDPKLIGMICLIGFQPENFRTEVGYILSPDYRQMGIMAEAMDAVVAYTFDTLNFHSLQAVIAPENLASERVLLRKGFVKEAHFKECRYWNGEFLDDAVYTLHRASLGI
ncbi:MAG: alanine acetyltransferase [Pedobacter sp.]|jgi:ribosomal-protein-alanine N-acetyltransferase|nr:alanine acetyltransferase [Pedobacter sp.]